MACKTSVEGAHRQANNTIEAMQDVLDDFMEALPLDMLDSDTISNLYKSMRNTVDSAKDGMRKFRHDNGIKPERAAINRGDLADYTTNAVLEPAKRKASQHITDIQNEMLKIPGLKTQTHEFTGAYNYALRETLRKSLPDDKLAAFIDAGESADTFQKLMKTLSQAEQARVYTEMNDAFPTEYQAFRNKISDMDWSKTTPDEQRAFHASLEEVETTLVGAFDHAQRLSNNPHQDALGLSSIYLDSTAEAFQHQPPADYLKQFTDDKLQNAVKHQFGGLTESVSSRLLKSGVPGAQAFAMNILETPSGFGGDIVRPNTASIRGDMLHRRSINKVNTAYSELLDTVAKEQGWNRVKRVMMQDAHPSTHPEIAQLNRQVMLHNNRNKLGKSSDAPEHIAKYNKLLNDEYHAIHDNGTGIVEGITKHNKIENYHNQRWQDDKIMALVKSPNSKKAVIELFEKGYARGGMDPDLAKLTAKAVIGQKITAMNNPGKPNIQLGEEQLKGLMPKLEELVTALKTDADVSPADLKRFVDALQDSPGGDSMPGYAHRRMNVDLEASHQIDGQQVSIVDLMNQDTAGNFDRYSKEANARIGIAEAMPLLNSDAAINDYIMNTGKQAQLMGTSVDTKMMRNTVNIMMGRAHEGQLPMDARRARDGVALAGMGGLGESQLAELGMAVNRGISGLVGVAQTHAGRKGRRAQARGIELTPDQSNSVKFMGELEELTGLFQNAHRIVRRNIHYDQADSNVGALSKLVDTATGGKHRNNLKAAQDRFTGYGAIRSMENQIAVAGLLQDVSKAFRGEKAFTSVKRFKDIGIDIENPKNPLFRNLKDYAVFDNNGNITELNIHRWSQTDRDSVGIVLNRHAGQTVQMGFAGEMSPLMENPWVKFMMQFRTYPILAAEKQQARNLKFADKEAATGIFLNAVSSSGARILRYSSLAAAQPREDRERYFNKRMESLAGDTWTYMGVAGMTPQLSSYATQLMGHPFGLGQDGHNVEGLHDMAPALSYASKLMSAHDSVTNGQGMNDNDYARIQSLIPLGTIGFSNILAGILRSKLDD